MSSLDAGAHADGVPKRTRPPIDNAVYIVTGIAIVIGYAAWQRGVLTETRLLFFAVLIPSIILHEISHGLLAKVYGDETAARAGRLTLNPLRHIDPFGTVILPAILVMTTGIAFGYAKPVPVETSRMSRNQTMLVGLVGPFTNIVLCLFGALLINVFYSSADHLTFGLNLLLQFGIANVALAVFNLIPIPPLDGSSVVERFLPARLLPGYLKFRVFAMVILLAIILLGNDTLNYVFDPALDLWFTLLPLS